MSKKIVQFNEEVIKGELKELVRSSVGETLNNLLEQEAQQLTNAARYERSAELHGYRSGHYSRNLMTTSGDVTLKIPKLKGVSFYSITKKPPVGDFFDSLNRAHKRRGLLFILSILTLAKKS